MAAGNGLAHVYANPSDDGLQSAGMGREPTDEEWVRILDTELQRRMPIISLYRAYYDGHHRLQFATSKFQEAFGNLFKEFATNWCKLVVDVAVERLQVQGFRFGEDEADDEAWGIWQANNMDSLSRMAHTEAVKTSVSYVCVGPPRELGGEPVFTVESGLQVVVAHHPADRRVRLAALKKYVDANGDFVSVLYKPDRICTFREPGMFERVMDSGLFVPPSAIPTGFVKTDEQPNPLGVIPIVPLENSPDVVTGGTSDLHSAMALNDAANKFFTDMLVGSEYHAFPQRVLTGIELPRDPVTGEVKDDAQIRASYSRLWAFESPDAKVFELGATGPANFVEGIDLAVQHIAAQTRTPPHYLLARLANLSGDALKAAETGLVSRCQAKMVDFSDPWEEAMRIAFAWRSIAREGWVGADEDEYRATLTAAETLWLDPESKDPINLTQSLTNKKAIGVPDEILWEEAGYSPAQIKRMGPLRDAQLQREVIQAQLMAQAAAPADPAAASGGGSGQEVQVQDEGSSTVVTGMAGPEPAPEDTASASSNGKAKSGASSS
jgi:hypothetical protein